MAAGKSTENRDPSELAKYNVHLGDVSIGLKKYNDAIEYYEKSIAIWTKITFGQV